MGPAVTVLCAWAAAVTDAAVTVDWTARVCATDGGGRGGADVGAHLAGGRMGMPAGPAP